MTVLTIDELREEMESGTCADNIFQYKGKEYYLGHEFLDTGPGKYYFGIANTQNDEGKEFDTFDDIMNAVLVGNKPFKEMLPFVKWY